MERDPLDQIVTPKDAEKIREQLSREPQLAGLPWPPPKNWPWHEVGVQIRDELAEVNSALGAFTGDAIQRSTLESHRRRLAQRLDRYKRIVFFSGWRPWQDREPPETGA